VLRSEDRESLGAAPLGEEGRGAPPDDGGRVSEGTPQRLRRGWALHATEEVLHFRSALRIGQTPRDERREVFRSETFDPLPRPGPHLFVGVPEGEKQRTRRLLPAAPRQGGDGALSHFRIRIVERPREARRGLGTGRADLREAATDAGIPTILLEAGETFKFQRNMVRRGVAGVLNVLRELQMVEGEVTPPSFRVIVKASDWVRAERGGILDLLVRPGDLVYQEDEIGSIRNPFGRDLAAVRTPMTGLVIGISTMPLVNPGDGVAHIAKLDKTLPMVEKHRRDGFDRSVLPFAED